MLAYAAFPVTFERVATVLRQQAKQGVEHVHFTGGEPTIHPRFIDILRLAKKLGMRTSIGTIGTRLADPAFAEAALPLLDEALFSLHGPDAATHDALTRRAGSFDRLMRAIGNARRRPGFQLFVNSVLTSHNLPKMGELAALVPALGAKLWVISNVTPEGAGLDAYGALTVRLSDVRAQAEAWVAAAQPAVVRFFGLPFCVLGRAWTHANDLHWNPRVTVEWATQPGKVVFDGVYSWAPDRKRAPVAACGRCRYQPVCFGVFEAYAERYGDAEVQPVIDEAAQREEGA